MGKKKADLNELATDGEVALLVMHCCSLGFLFWVNFLAKAFFGFPLFQRTGHSLHYYIKDVSNSLSLSTVFWWVTLVASSLVVARVWYRSRKFKCKWRLRFLSLLMSFLCFGFAELCRSWESLTVAETRYYIDFLKEELKESHPDMQDFLKSQINNAEGQLEHWEYSNSGEKTRLRSSALDSY